MWHGLLVGRGSDYPTTVNKKTCHTIAKSHAEQKDNRVLARPTDGIAPPLAVYVGHGRASIISVDGRLARKIETQKGVEDWLSRLQREHPVPSHGLSKAGIRKMISRLHQELALYEGSQEVKSVK